MRRTRWTANVPSPNQIVDQRGDFAVTLKEHRMPMSAWFLDDPACTGTTTA
jgi:hypothetical protein